MEKEGKSSFRVIGTGKDSYATPTVFLNTDGSTSDVKIDKKDVQVKAETTYFTAADVEEAVIKVLNGEFGTEVTSLQAGKTAYAVYQSVDQNGFAYGTGKEYDVTFELSTTFGELEVKGGKHNVGRTYTYETKSNTNGRAVVEFTSDSATTVNIDILGSRNVLPTKVATVKFTQYATGETTGVIAATDVDNDTLTIGSNVYSYADAKEYRQNGSKITKSEFEKLIVKENARVSITKDADGKLTFDVLAAAASADIPVTVTSAVAADTDGDNKADEIVLTFSKDITDANLSAELANITLTNGTVDSITTGTANDAVVTLDVTATGLAIGTLTIPAITDLAVDTADFAKYTKVLEVAVAPTLVNATANRAAGSAGTPQVEELTATAASATGDAIVTVQAAGFNGGVALNIPVPVIASDDATVVGTKVYNALRTNTTVTSFFNITQGATTDIVLLTAKTAVDNDPTTVITLANNVAATATSADDTPGSAPTAEVVTVTVNAGTVTATITDGKFSKAVSFQVVAGDSASEVNAKLYAALLVDTDIKARYNLGVTATTVTLTNKTAGTTPATTVTVK